MWGRSILFSRVVLRITPGLRRLPRRRQQRRRETPAKVDAPLMIGMMRIHEVRIRNTVTPIRERTAIARAQPVHVLKKHGVYCRRASPSARRMDWNAHQYHLDAGRMTTVQQML